MKSKSSKNLLIGTSVCFWVPSFKGGKAVRKGKRLYAKKRQDRKCQVRYRTGKLWVIKRCILDLQVSFTWVKTWDHLRGNKVMMLSDLT